MRRIKLIWDFKGPDALETAKHHCIHLQEFAAVEKLPFEEVNHSVLHDMHAIAFVVVNEAYMKTYRDALKPHRGALA